MKKLVKTGLLTEEQVRELLELPLSPDETPAGRLAMLHGLMYYDNGCQECGRDCNCDIMVEE